VVAQSSQLGRCARPLLFVLSANKALLWVPHGFRFRRAAHDFRRLPRDRRRQTINVGEHLLENVRLVDTATGHVLANAEPSLATMHLRQILLASATVTRLTLADLQARGIAITKQNFQALARGECSAHSPPRESLRC
jgi:hypothetical protein